MADNKLKVISAEQVAYDLMLHIADRESVVNKEKYEKPDPRTYYLTLFRQCIRAEYGERSLKEVLDEGNSGGSMQQTRVVRS
jgi:hypothetical protein